MALIIVETTYNPPIDKALWDELAERATPCMTERNIIWRRSFVSRDRKRSICELDAVDADTVRAAYQRGNVPYDQIWSASVVDPASMDLDIW